MYQAQITNVASPYSYKEAKERVVREEIVGVELFFLKGANRIHTVVMVWNGSCGGGQEETGKKEHGRGNGHKFS